jgi:hypothetical protein
MPLSVLIPAPPKKTAFLHFSIIRLRLSTAGDKAAILFLLRGCIESRFHLFIIS